VTLPEVVIEALRELGGTGSVSEVKKIIEKKYGTRWKDVGTTMADMVASSISSKIPRQHRVLKRLGMGLYTLSAGTNERRPAAVKNGARQSTTATSQVTLRNIYSYRDASALLERKSQLQVVLAAADLTDLSSSQDHDAVQEVFRGNGWETEVSKFPVAGYRFDAYRDKTGVEIERSLIDAIHRSLFRSLWAYRRGVLDCLVFIVPTYKEPKFSSVTRDIEAFSEVLPYPILVVGVDVKK
jgi:hypothetical protein